MPFGPYYAGLPSDGGTPAKRYVDSTSWDAIVDNFVNWKGNVNGGGFTLANVVINSALNLTVTGSGKVGIGLSSNMQAALHVQSTTADTQLYISDTAPSVHLSNHQVAASATAGCILAMATGAGNYALPNAGDTVLATYGSAHGNIYINPNYPNGGGSKFTFVVGDLTVSSTTAVTTLTVTSSNSDAALNLSATSAASAAGYIKMSRATTGAARAYWMGTGINGGSEFSIYDATATAFRLQILATGAILFPSLQASTSYGSDALAAGGGVVVGQLYRNGSVVQIRVT